MTQLSPSQKEILRSQPQSSTLGLSIFQPQIIFQARVNSTGTFQGMREIPYDSVSTGSYTNIENGFTVWIGSTQGGQEIGKLRVRSATSSQIVVSENSNIDWQDNEWLTIFKYVELWPIYPRIIQNPSNPEDTIWYKDYDIPYTNQNSILGTFINMGPHRAAKRDPASGLARIYYSSTGSYNLLGNSLNYGWTFEGATTPSSTSAEPGWITYNRAGNFVTRLSISGSNGSIDTAYRYVTIDPPEYLWQLTNFGGSRSEGGYTASIRVFSLIPLQENAVVVLYKNSFYGNTHINLGGNYPNAEDIFFVGYIDKDSISYDYEHSEVTFDAVSITGRMKTSSGFSVSVESKANPSYWYELLDMDGRRALYHYLRWHTTALMISDFQFVGDDRKIQFFDSDRESMYDAVDNYMRNALVGQTVSDRQGKAWMEVQARAYENPTGSFPAYLDISRRDWMNSPTIDERLSPEISFMEYGGVAYSGTTTGTFTPLIGSAPGTAPDFHGSIENHEGMALLGQSQLNRVVGNIFANANSKFPTVNMDMGINASNLDIAPQEALRLFIMPEDTVRNVTIDSLYLPEGMSWKYEPRDYSLLPTIELIQLVNGKAGETVTIPNIEDVGEGFSLPPFNLPPYPDVFNSVTNDSLDDAPPKVLVHDTTYGLIFTQTFNTPRPTWYTVNAGLTQTQYQNINRIVICPNGAIYVGKIGGGAPAATSFIARANFVGDVFVILEDAASMSAKYGGGDVWASCFGCNPLMPEQVVYVLNNLSISKPYLGANQTWVEGVNAGMGNQNGSVSFGDNCWILSGGGLGAERLFVYTNDLGSVFRTLTPSTTPGLKSGEGRHVRIGTTGSIFLYTNIVDQTITRVDGNGTTAIQNIGSNYAAGDAFADDETIFAIDTSGQFIYTIKASSGRGKSTDGGYTLIDIANLVVSAWRYTNCGTAPRWIAVSSYVFYTNDSFSTAPIDKRGDILNINPLLNLNNVRVVP